VDPAWIAVVGTLGGVIVTSITGVSVGVLTSRSQQRSVTRRRSHEVAEHRRAERRDTFVEFLAAYSELREKVLTLGQQAPANAQPLSEVFPVEVSRFSRADQALRIFADDRTGEAARKCSSQLWALAEAVGRGDVNAIATDREDGRRLRRELRAEMQRELGVGVSTQ
jgi:citrate synthase